MNTHYFFFIIVFLVYTLINSYVFHRSKQALPQSKIFRTIFYIIYLFLFSAFIIAMLGRNILPMAIQKILYRPGTVWMGMVLYLLAFFLVTDFIFFIIRVVRWQSPANNPRWRKIQVISGYIIVIGLAIYGYYQFTHPKVVEQKISIAKKAGEYKSQHRASE